MFSKIDYLYWAESKIGLGLSESPLHLNSVNYIGEIMTGDPSIGANVGWMANGYMNFGIFGVFIYGILIPFFLVLIDRMSSNFKNGILLATFSAPYFFLITSSDLFTWLLTGGILPMLIILFLTNKLKLSWLNYESKR